MKRFSRREVLKLGAALVTTFAVSKTASASQSKSVLVGRLNLKGYGEDFSPETGKKRKAIASTCWNCVARDTMIGYVEDDRVVKIEGNHRSIRNRGKICSKGQAGVNQIYDPDRVLYPLKRVGKRGDGKWKKITWDEALGLLVKGGKIAGHKVKGLKTLLNEGHPEKFMFHYGRMKGSDSKIVKTNFLGAFGTKTIGNHTAICEGGKWTAQELVWGKHYDINDTEHTKMILNFGCNFFETHTSHIQLYERTIKAMVDRGVKLYTFDVRLSNTAAKSTEWLPIKPGGDLAVVLALANVVMQNNLYDANFINTWTNVTVAQLKKHLRKYTTTWAEKISGVPAKKILQLAFDYARAKPGTCVSYRGAVAHYNGVELERACKMLDAILGYIDVKGGTLRAVGAKWKYPKAKAAKKAKKLKIVDGFPGVSAYPTHHVSQQVLKMIKDGRNGRPDIYMTYCYQPAYVNGNCAENIAILKNEKLVPFLVAVSPFYGETESLADLILPDVTYLERWSWDDMVSYAMIPEFNLRQPLVKALGESRQFQDVCVDLANQLGLKMPFKSAEDFIKKSCKKSKVSFSYLKRNGVWHDPKAKPKYKPYAKQVKAKDLAGDKVVFDSATGVYWNWTKSKAKTRDEAISKGYTKTKNAYKGYVGQKIGNAVYKGFKPDKLNKSGRFEIYSGFLKKKGFNPLPSWMAVPEFEKIGKDDLMLIGFKVSVQTHSRTQNSKWLTEIYHDNPAWINPVTAKQKGIRDGSKIRVKSGVGEIVTKAKVTEGIVPGAIGISNHCGHWQYGRYASGKKAPQAGNNDKDLRRRWWKGHGVHPNWVISNSPDPIAGQWRMNDSVVKVTRA